MKWIFFLLCIVAGSPVAFGQTGSIEVTVTNISSNKGGELSVGVFQKAGFPEMGKQDLGKWNPINSTAQTVQIEDIPAGTYGLAVFQDLDGNRKLNKNVFGYPSEPFGFSNDAKAVFGPPAFSDAAVQVVAGKVTRVSVNLR